MERIAYAPPRLPTGQLLPATAILACPHPNVCPSTASHKTTVLTFIPYTVTTRLTPYPRDHSGQLPIRVEKSVRQPGILAAHPNTLGSGSRRGAGGCETAGCSPLSPASCPHPLLQTSQFDSVQA